MAITLRRVHDHGRRRARLSWASAAALLALQPAHAFQIDTGEPDVRAVWDNTFKYSNAFRMKSPSQAIVGGQNINPASPNYFPNTDDGSNNFKRGLISNRLDLFSEFDLTYKNVGLRLSGAAWFDSVYNRRNDNCLLYTSPSPRDRQKSRMPSSA